jgi:hypothetical protein
MPGGAGTLPDRNDVNEGLSLGEPVGRSSALASAAWGRPTNVQAYKVRNNLSIALPPDWTEERLVDFVLSGRKRNLPYEEMLAELLSVGLDRVDAELLIDRSLGGLFRAGTGNPANEPSSVNDPIAWAGYQRGLRDPALVAFIFPQLAAPVARAVPEEARHRAGLRPGAPFEFVFSSVRTGRKWWQFWR